MEQQIRFCTTSDGVRIAYAVTGTGYPLVWVPGWLSHAEIDWDFPILGERYHELTKDFMLVRLDKRGTGLSTRGLPEYTREGWVRDVEAVVEHEKLKRFALAGYSEGGPVAVDYATRHPRKVSHLVLMGTGAGGEDTPERREVREAMVTIIRANWGSAVKMMSDAFLGEDAPPEAQQMFAAYQQQSADAEDAAKMLRGYPTAYDIAHLAPKIRVPTLSIHARGDRLVPIERGQRLAALIPGATFKSVEGQHVPGRKQSAQINAAILDFVLGSAASAEKAGQSGTASPSGLVTILFTDMESSSALRQQLGDAKAQELVRTHNTIVRQALKAQAGSEIKHTGDGIMASFPSTIGALDCAIAIQRGVAAYLAAHPGAPLGVYVGLNAGEPIAEEQDLFGTSVDLARRLCDQAAPGEILVSNVVRELASGKDFLFSDRGAAPLKGFDDPVRLYEVRWREE